MDHFLRRIKELIVVIETQEVYAHLEKELYGFSFFGDKRILEGDLSSKELHFPFLNDVIEQHFGTLVPYLFKSFIQHELVVMQKVAVLDMQFTFVLIVFPYSQ